MAHRLDAMAIRIAYERAVVIGMVLRPKPGRSIIAAASRHRSGMKRAHRLPVRSAEAEMCPGNRSSQFRLAGDGELDAERSRRRAVIGASAVTEIDDAHEPQRAQRVIVEMPAAPDIPYPEGNMIQHVPPPSER